MTAMFIYPEQKTRTNNLNHKNKSRYPMICLTKHLLDLNVSHIKGRNVLSSTWNEPQATGGHAPSLKITGRPTHTHTHTSLGLWEALVQAEDDFVYEVLDVAVLGPSYEHHPVMCEAFGRSFLAQLSAVAQFQLHLYRALHTHKHHKTFYIIFTLNCLFIWLHF